VSFFWFWREIGFGFTYLRTYTTIQLWHCVSFFGSGGKLVLVLHTYLVYNTVLQLCQFFGCGGEIVLKMRTPFDFLMSSFYKTTYWVTLL
jgi:hypothetical protein